MYPRENIDVASSPETGHSCKHKDRTFKEILPFGKIYLLHMLSLDEFKPVFRIFNISTYIDSLHFDLHIVILVLHGRNRRNGQKFPYLIIIVPVIFQRVLDSISFANSIIDRLDKFIQHNYVGLFLLVGSENTVYDIGQPVAAEIP